MLQSRALTGVPIAMKAVVLVMLAAGSASAAPLARLAEDIDGDGKPDAIELGGDGVLHIEATPRGEVRLAPAITAAHLELARYRDGYRVIVANIETATAHEAVLVQLDAGAWHEAARIAVGGQGLDKDFATAVSAASTGVYRYQQRSDIHRCDGKPTFLFAEGYQPATRTFHRAVPPLEIDPNATALAVHLDASPPAAPLLYRAHGASHQPGVRDAGGLTIPHELDDGKLDSAWIEDLGTDGHGQFFTFEPRVHDIKAQQLRIVPGNHSSVAALKRFNRPRELYVATAEGSWKLTLPDASSAPLGTAYVVDLPKPIAGCVTVLLASTYGTTNETAIAELEVFGEGERAGGGDAILAQVIASGADGATNAAAVLAKRGAAGANAIDAELGKTTNPMARHRLVAALTKIADPAAAAGLARAATQGWVHDRDLLDVIAALGALGQLQELHDLAANTNVAVPARVAAASQITVSGPGFALLVDLAGDATGKHVPKARELRRAVIAQLGTAPVAQLVQAAGAETNTAAAGDLWRAVTRSARANPAQREAALAALTAALPATTDYERRYRLVDGIASLGDAAALQGLDRLLRGLPAGAQTSALRQVAVRAIAAMPRPASTSFVLDAARDPDPGVRIAALSALSAAETDAGTTWRDAGGPDAIDRVVAGALAADSWPEVRRRAASVLGGRCARPAPAHALVEAVLHDHDIAVRSDSLTALVQCRAAGIGELLAKLWDDGKAPLELRQRAVDEAVTLGDPRLATALVTKLGRWRGEAIESSDALALAQNAAAAVGRLSPPGAAQALLDALDDTAFPEIVQAAALGLGALGKLCPPAAKTKLDALAHADDASAVIAKRAAAQCGR